MVAFLIALAGIILTMFGLVGILAFFMPTFGGRNDGATVLTFGIGAFAFGISLVFYAGSWI